MSKKKKIAYMVPSLKISGPSTQLSMIIKESVKRFDVEIFALSTETKEISMRENFENLGVKVSYLKGTLLSKRQKIMKIVKRGDYSLLHSQGFLPDLLLASLSIKTPWLVSIRNYAYEDYVLKFGRLRGRLLAKLHISAFKRPNKLIACSKYVQHCCQLHGISSFVIRNGVDLNRAKPQSRQKPAPEVPEILIVGSLNARKNNMPILKAHAKLSSVKTTKLILLGDGSQRNELERIAHRNVEFKGQVNDVERYYQSADLYISNSLSEGMPNSVLEAISHNLICLVSDIAPHRELAAEFPELVSIIDSSMSIESLASEIGVQLTRQPVKPNHKQRDQISEKYMAEQYVATYWSIINDALK